MARGRQARAQRSRQPARRKQLRPQPAQPTCLISLGQPAVPTRLLAAAPQPARVLPTRRAMQMARPRTARPGPQAPRSWARPKTRGLPARSTRAPAAIRAEGWLEPFPSRWLQDLALARPAARRPTKATAVAPSRRLQVPQAALPRQEEIPRSARAAEVRRPAAAGVALEPGRALEGPRAAARPKLEPAARRWRPSWGRREAQPGAQALRAAERPRVAVAAASTAAEEEEHPMSARPAGLVPAATQRGARPRWERRRQLRGLQAHRPTLALVRRVEARAPGLKASPTWPGPTWKEATPADPSWAPTQEERRLSGPRGSARARRRAAPRSPRCQDATGCPPAVAETPGAPAARSFCASGAGA